MGAKSWRSNKQSNTNADYKRQLRRTTFFLDRSLSGKEIPKWLRDNGVKVEAHSVWFKHNTEDVDWLAAVGEKKWVVLMGDLTIGRDPFELDALLAAQVKAFALVRSDLLKAHEQTQVLINAMPQMLRMVEDNRFPFIAKIHQDGSVDLWKTDVKFPKGQRGKKRYRPLKEK